MNSLQSHLQNSVDESIRGIFSKKFAYDPSNPQHKLLYKSFVTWYKGVASKYPEDVIIDMLHDVEEDISFGEI